MFDFSLRGKKLVQQISGKRLPQSRKMPKTLFTVRHYKSNFLNLGSLNLSILSFGSLPPTYRQTHLS